MLLDPQQLQHQLLQVIEPLYLVVVIEFHVNREIITLVTIGNLFPQPGNGAGNAYWVTSSSFNQIEENNQSPRKLVRHIA